MNHNSQPGVLLNSRNDTLTATMRARSTFALGFRPFFLGAGVVAAVWVPLWLLIFGGSVAVPVGSGGTLWHAHEMIFGFTIAVIAGFLLTAVRNWTGRPVPTGAGLVALALTWLAGRIVMLFGAALPPLLVAVVDLAFLPVLAGALAVPLLKAGNKRNYALVVLLSVMFVANLVFHFGGGYDPAYRALNATILLVLAIIHIVGGRIVPNFTQNALRHLTVTRSRAADWSSFLALAALIPLEAATGNSPATAVVALLAGVLNLWRMWGWGSLDTRKSPILWILHLGYLWLPLGLVVKGLAGFVPAVTPSIATHMLTVGAIGTLILGMMTRVSLGHTGRPLVVRPIVTAAYIMLILAVLARTVLPVVATSLYWPGLIASAVLWSGSFLVFLGVYAPILTAPRPDGKPG